MLTRGRRKQRSSRLTCPFCCATNVFENLVPLFTGDLTRCIRGHGLTPIRRPSRCQHLRSRVRGWSHPLTESRVGPGIGGEGARMGRDIGYHYAHAGGPLSIKAACLSVPDRGRIERPGIPSLPLHNLHATSNTQYKTKCPPSSPNHNEDRHCPLQRHCALCYPRARRS